MRISDWSSDVCFSDLDTIQMPDGEVLPIPGSGTVAGGVTAPAAYVPRTEQANTPWRFNMQQEGQSMSADKFDDWMTAKSVRVATGKPATPLVQNCPTPEGDKDDSDRWEERRVGKEGVSTCRYR